MRIELLWSFIVQLSYNSFIPRRWLFVLFLIQCFQTIFELYWYNKNTIQTKSCYTLVPYLKSLGTRVINYTEYQGLQNGTLTHFMTPNLTSFNRKTPQLDVKLFNIFFFINSLSFSILEFVLRCCRAMHGLSFKCFVINYSGI